LRAAAHALKGASGNIGARSMAELYEALQQCGQSGVLADAGDLLECLERSYAAVRAELSPWTS